MFARPTRVFPHQLPGWGRRGPPQSPASACASGCGPSLLRYLTRAGPPYSQAHQPGWSVCPSRPLGPGPRAARLGRSAWAPSARSRAVGPGSFRAFGPGASFGSDSAQGLLAATRPLPAGIPGPSPRLGPPWPFPPVRHSSLPRLLTRSRPPFTRSGPSSAQASPSGLRRSLPCQSVSQSCAEAIGHPRPRSSVRSPQPWVVGQASAPQAFGISPSPSLSIPLGCPGPSAWPRESQHPRSVKQTPEAPRVSQVRWPRAWPPCLRPGLPTSAPAPKRQGHLCPPVRHPRLPSPARLERQFGAHGRSVTPASVVRALPAWPHTGPPALAPRAPLARPRCRSTCRFGPCFYSA